MNNQLTIVNVTLEDREDGGLSVYSDDLPGLILSGSDRSEVANKIVPAIQGLFKYKGFQLVSVRPAKPISEVLQLRSPRGVDMQVHHEQFVVELDSAA